MLNIRNPKQATLISLWVLFIALLSIDFSVFGQDGYIGWAPIISEYLKGSEDFKMSLVHFGGQNLQSIYGSIPLWSVFRFFSLDYITSLNLSFFGAFCFYIYFTFSYIQVSKKQGITVYLSSFFLLLLNPALVNRLYSGHLNLLYGILPCFALLLLAKRTYFIDLFVSTIAIWFAFSIQAYQVILYSIFYVPVFLFLFWEKRELSKVVKTVAVFTIGFALAFENFQEMLSHASSHSNIREITQVMPYSLIESQWQDVFSLIFVNPSQLLPGGNNLYFQHEINYPLILMLLWFLIFSTERKLTFLLLATFFVLISFSFNFFPFNELAFLPGFKIFRVPQRSLFFLTMILPLLMISENDLNIQKEHFLFAGSMAILGFFVPYIEIIFLGSLLVGLLLYRFFKLEVKSFSALCLLFHFCVPNTFKLRENLTSHFEFKRAINLMQDLVSQEDFNYDETYHIIGGNPVFVNASAKVLGIKTMEGYGHPPKWLLESVSKHTHIKFNKNTNHLYLAGKSERFKALYREIGISRIVTVEKAKN